MFLKNNFLTLNLFVCVLCGNFYFDNCRFAAALHDLQIDCWVINVVPVSGFNTLPILYDRGLTGVMHDWYENILMFLLSCFYSYLM